MIELSQNQLVDLLMEKLKDASEGWTSGTYDKADPTHFEKGTSKFGIPYTLGDEGELLDGPEPENISVDWNDVTWGIEFSIVVPSIRQPIRAYWSREFGNGKSHWTRCHEDFFRVVQAILTDAQEPDFCDQLEYHKIYM